MDLLDAAKAKASEVLYVNDRPKQPKQLEQPNRLSEEHKKQQREHK